MLSVTATSFIFCFSMTKFIHKSNGIRLECKQPTRTVRQLKLQAKIYCQLQTTYCYIQNGSKHAVRAILSIRNAIVTTQLEPRVDTCSITVSVISAGLTWVLLMLQHYVQETGPRPRTRTRTVFSILVVISLVGTISGKSLKFTALPRPRSWI